MQCIKFKDLTPNQPFLTKIFRTIFKKIEKKWTKRLPVRIFYVPLHRNFAQI